MTFSFFRKWQDGRTGTPSGSRVPSKLPDDDMSWLFPPRNVHDCAAWDRYWHDQAAHRLSPPLFDMFCNDAPLIQCLVKRAAKTVLCAGNGISQEPRALAAAGFEVTAMDFSRTAIQLGEAWQFGQKELDRFCTEEHWRPDGSARFIVGDILDRSVCPGPFDAIIERRTLQLFPEEERGAALDALASRLQRNGLFLSHCHDGGWKPPGTPVHQVERFFLARDWLIWRPRWGESLDHTGRVAWLEMSTG